MAGTLYVTPFSPGQTVAVPTMVPAAAGFGLIDTAKLAEIVPLPHALLPATVITPGLAVEEKFTVMLLVLLPEAIVAPVGKVQV